MSESTEAVLRELIQADLTRMHAMPDGQARRVLGLAIGDMESFRRKLEEDRKMIDAEPVP